MGDTGDSLIDGSEGHGSQALINLLISGRAASYVWDGDKDVGGLSKTGHSFNLSNISIFDIQRIGWYRSTTDGRIFNQNGTSSLRASGMVFEESDEPSLGLGFRNSSHR